MSNKRNVYALRIFSLKLIVNTFRNQFYWIDITLIHLRIVTFWQITRISGDSNDFRRIRISKLFHKAYNLLIVSKIKGFFVFWWFVNFYASSPQAFGIHVFKVRTEYLNTRFLWFLQFPMPTLPCAR